MNQKGFAVVYLILGLVILLFGAIYIGKLSVNLPFSQTSTPANQQSSSNWQQTKTEETVNWKTYTNTKYGYAIKYPQDYQESPTLLNLSDKPSLLQNTFFYATSPKSGGGPAPFISVIVWKKENTSLIRWLDDHSTSEAFDSEIVQENPTLFYPGVASKKEVKIANRNGFRFTSTTMNGPVERTIIDGGLYVYEVSLWTNNNLSKDPEISNNYQLFLSTFKFTGQGQTAATADWKIYTSQNMNLSISHPSSWKITDSGTDQYKFETVKIEGLEGSVSIIQGSGFGGGPCKNKLVDVQTSQGTLKMCNWINGAAEFWQTDNQVTGTLNLINLPKNNNLSIKFNVIANPPQSDNRNTILKILSTFKFTSS